MCVCVCISYALIWYCECFKEKVYIIDHGISLISLFFIFMPRCIYIYENIKYTYDYNIFLKKNQKQVDKFLFNKKH